VDESSSVLGQHILRKKVVLRGVCHNETSVFIPRACR
jgi:hypothetical protein